MKLLLAFLKLVRVRNLFFIALTQFLFHWCVIVPIFKIEGSLFILSNQLLSLLILSSVFIAAAGYIINDYFDIDIDQVNKPTKNVVDNIIPHHWAMALHTIFSFIGVIIGFYISRVLNFWWIGVINFLCTILLFFYSTTFKKKNLSGNLIISFLTAWSAGIIGVVTYFISEPSDTSFKIIRIALLYSSFAFIISLIREVIKDMEDVQGDSKYGARTMPVVWGINTAKVFVAVWLIVLISSVLLFQLYSLPLQWWWMEFYLLLFIVVPLTFSLSMLLKATSKRQFHQISNQLKWVMFLGILSMLFFAN